MTLLFTNKVKDKVRTAESSYYLYFIIIALQQVFVLFLS